MGSGVRQLVGIDALEEKRKVRLGGTNLCSPAALALNGTLQPL